MADFGEQANIMNPENDMNIILSNPPFGFPVHNELISPEPVGDNFIIIDIGGHIFPNCDVYADIERKICYVRGCNSVK